MCDPDTTLFTFLLSTLPSINSVTLRGSWDNFSKPYTMERDSRRDRGQWRGCHAFRGIICDGDSMLSQGRDGGLKMGHTYYYYYELDGKTEAHDASMPSTRDEQSDMAVETKNYETLSPASLRRFLAEDASVRERKETEAKLSLTIFQEIVEENEDDDDNFATSAKSEAAPFTILSPPPSMRSHSPSPPSTIVPQCSRSPPTSCQNSLTPTSTPASVYGHKSHFSIDSSCCALSESESESESEFPPPFSHSDDDDDDRLSVKEEDSLPSPSMSSEPENLRSLPRNLGAGLSTYSLPSSSPEDGKLSTSRNATPLGLIGTSGLPTQRSIELPTSNTPLLESPIPHAGFDDLASDLDWVVNAVGPLGSITF
ncbi:hypothetical protein P8C59_006786 [Phyllachora maydis]|uniref:Uncharacterized protein n=1 Tax=Phyllachora maydis TaxID=1825666 RepID=A0AAD9I890_9PEZI|nr:hypothetical protein P8C59_006786 [Phyllachora maydis]